MPVKRARVVRVSVTGPKRIEHGLPAFPPRPQPRQQLFHGAIVGHQQTLAVERKRKVTVADFERHPDGLGAIPRSHCQHGFRTAFDGEDGGVTVAFLLDGIPIGSPIAVSANGDFQFRWDTTTTEIGTHSLAIEATDAEGTSAIIGIRRVTLVR